MASFDEKASVLPPKLGGGPHGLGDPNDRSLRKVEMEVLVPKKMRDKAKAEKCVDEVRAFSECGKEHGLLVIFNCRKQNQILKDCLGNWYNNEEFKNLCKEEYINERNEYRRTGILKKHRNLQH